MAKRRRKSWCIACRGSGILRVWLGIRPRMMRSRCWPCLGSGDGEIAAASSQPSSNPPELKR